MRREKGQKAERKGRTVNFGLVKVIKEGRETTKRCERSYENQRKENEERGIKK